jgi:hypothetical protein
MKAVITLFREGLTSWIRIRWRIAKRGKPWATKKPENSLDG